ALLLTFILTPLVTALQRRGLRRVLAVALVALFAFGLLGAIGWIVTLQVGGLLREIPQHRDEITAKVEGLRGSGPSAVQRLLEMAGDITGQFGGGSQAAPDEPPPQRVVVVNSQPETITWLPAVVGPVLEVAITGVLVAILVVFMLSYREDLRNRL